MLSSAPRSPSPLRPFAERVLVVMALGGLALLAWQLSELLLVVFGAVVVGVLLHGLASTLRKRLPVPVPEWAALGLVILSLVLILSSIVLLFGAEVAAQIDAFRTTLPAAWNKFHAWLQSGPLGPQIESIPDQLRDGASTLATHAGAIVLSAGGGITDAVLMIVGGVYLAAQPKLYRRGLLRLLPRDRRDVADEALTASGKVLRAWLGGQFLAMLVIGSLTGLGLWLLGVPVALGIGLLTALLDFIPIVGPIVAAVPAVLLGFTVSPQVALGALLVFVVLQQLEGHVLQPLIQA
ncbi:AI-2E family transporter, partial [Xanthomonas translucens]